MRGERGEGGVMGLFWETVGELVRVDDGVGVKDRG